MKDLEALIISSTIVAVFALVYVFFLSDKALKYREERKKQKKLQQLEAGKPYYKCIQAEVKNDEKEGIPLRFFLTFQRMLVKQGEILPDPQVPMITIEDLPDIVSMFHKNQVYSSRSYPLAKLMPRIREKEEELEKK
jgi:hypothetical protein